MSRSMVIESRLLDIEGVTFPIVKLVWMMRLSYVDLLMIVVQRCVQHSLGFFKAYSCARDCLIS